MIGQVNEREEEVFVNKVGFKLREVIVIDFYRGGDFLDYN